MTIFIIGGGCYGSGYLRQFRKARARGKMPVARWVVLDRDAGCRAATERAPEDDLEIRAGEWRALLAAAIASGELQAGDLVVPSPFQGALVTDWLRDEAAGVGRSLTPVAGGELGHGLRFEQAAPAGDVRYVSFAGWTCPVHCIEPATCPATRGPKDWDLRDTLREVSNERAYDRLFTFSCLHWLYGVGAVPAEEFLDARRYVREGPPGKLLLASLSTCHGALSAFELADERTPGHGDAGTRGPS